MKKDGDICLVAPGSAKCLAIASSDTAPVLVSLGAEAVLVGPKGERRVNLEALYRDDGIDYSTKANDEVLKGLLIPRQVLGWRNIYMKLRPARLLRLSDPGSGGRPWTSMIGVNAAMPAWY